MILCIESYTGDKYLSGHRVAIRELKEQIQQVHGLFDPIEDNFVALLCRMYGWNPIEESIPDLTYDRDTGLLF